MTGRVLKTLSTTAFVDEPMETLLANKLVICAVEVVGECSKTIFTFPSVDEMDMSERNDVACSKRQ